MAKNLEGMLARMAAMLAAASFISLLLMIFLFPNVPAPEDFKATGIRLWVLTASAATVGCLVFSMAMFNRIAKRKSK